MKWLDGVIEALDMFLEKPGAKRWKAWHAAVRGATSRTQWLSNNNNKDDISKIGFPW